MSTNDNHNILHVLVQVPGVCKAKHQEDVADLLLHALLSSNKVCLPMLEFLHVVESCLVGLQGRTSEQSIASSNTTRCGCKQYIGSALVFL